MSNLQKAADKLKEEVAKISNKIRELETQINEKVAQHRSILNGKVPREQFRGYLLKQFEREAEYFKRNLLNGLKDDFTSFSKLEDSGVQSYFLTGEAKWEDFHHTAFYFYLGEQMADRFISVLPDEHFDENALTPEERNAQAQQLETEIQALKAEKAELVAQLAEVGIS